MINVNSFQSLGAVDGPGLRVVIFLQGCNAKCRYCHNPETIGNKKEKLYTPEELEEKISRYDNFVKNKGGVTFSGGEPLLQAKELLPLFKSLKKKGYHIALDTNGTILNDCVKELLEYVDLVLLDIKMPDKLLYSEFARCDFDAVMEFFNYLSDVGKKVWIRQVVVEGVNNTQKNIDFIKEIAQNPVVEKVEFLPFKKLCLSKYDAMNLEFEMQEYNETSADTIENMYKFIEN